MIRRAALWLAALWLCAGMATAGDYQQFINTPFPIPDHYRLVNDFCNMLRITSRVALEKRLQALERKNGTQIVFLSVPNTGPDGDRVYAEAVYKKWDVGNNLQGNGILFLVGQTDFVMLTGPGISGAVPDVLLARLHRNLLLPIQERDDMTDGIVALIDSMIDASSKEHTMPTAFDYAHPLHEDDMPPERRQAIIVLGTVTALYAGWLLWQRIRRKPQP